MPVKSPEIETGTEGAVLAAGALRIELDFRPFSFTVRRAGRRLLRAADVWVAEGQIHDRFVLFTEGVVAHEDLQPRERARRATVAERLHDGLELSLALHGGREATLRLRLHGEHEFELELECEGGTAAGGGGPLRLAAEWDLRSGERFVGLGARHGTQLDQRGRAVQLGADRRYTGPDCPPDLLAGGGIPQGDCAPVPWLLSSRGYGAWVQTEANGTRFEMVGDRTTVSTRAHAGPLRIRFMCQRTPAARLRALCAHTGFPALLPEWGYGFWKSRDVYEHQDDVLEDFHGFQEHRIPLDAIVIDSPWETQYNTWKFNPHQFPDAAGLVWSMREQGVRTVVWVTPWTNLDSRDGQIPPQPASERLHREPASNYAAGAAEGHFVRDGAGGLPDAGEPAGRLPDAGEPAGRLQDAGEPAGRLPDAREPAGRSPDAGEDPAEPFVAQWWMGTGSPIDFTSPAAEEWWRTQAKQVLELGVEGVKADDGEGYYIPDHVRLADGRTGAQAAWALGGLHRRCMQRALDEVHPGRGVLFGRSGWTGQQATGHTWAGDQASDFWSLRALVGATLSAACSGFSNWSHDVGGYLGHRLVERCPPELLIRWAQFGCFTPLMHAHGRMPQEPWHYSQRVLELYRGYVLLHEQLVPYVRAAAATAARTGLPIIRPLCLTDPGDERGWTIADAYGYGPALWVAPMLDDGARERDVGLPRGEWIETWSGRTVTGGQEVEVPAPLEQIPVWVRAGSIIVTYPADRVAAGLGDEPGDDTPVQATLWGRPRLGATGTRLADGTLVTWSRGRWSVSAERVVEFREIFTD